MSQKRKGVSSWMLAFRQRTEKTAGDRDGARLGNLSRIQRLQRLLRQTIRRRRSRQDFSQ